MTSICQKTVIRDTQIDNVHPGKAACDITKCTVVLWWPCLCDRNPSLLTGGCLLQPQLWCWKAGWLRTQHPGLTTESQRVNPWRAPVCDETGWRQHQQKPQCPSQHTFPCVPCSLCRWTCPFEEGEEVPFLSLQMTSDKRGTIWLLLMAPIPSFLAH